MEMLQQAGEKIGQMTAQVTSQVKQLVGGAGPEQKTEELAGFSKDVSDTTKQMDTQAPTDQSQDVASKADLGDRAEGLATDTKMKDIASHDIDVVPSHEKFKGTSTQSGATPTSPRQTAQTFEERTYQQAKGAESPDGAMEKLHLHEKEGTEFEGAALAGRSAPFDAPPHGAGAPTSDQDRPVKLASHDYRNELPEAPQQQQERGDADASRLGMEAGGQMETEGAATPNVDATTVETPSVTGADASRLSMEEGGMLQSGATGKPDMSTAQAQESSGPTETIAPDMMGGSGDAAAGMSAHQKDFEAETVKEAKGAEGPGGPLEALHLHAAHGSEGQGSKADQQLGQVLQEGVPQPPPGAGAPTSAQDPPDKIRSHGRDEEGVAGRAGATDSTNLTGTAQEEGVAGGSAGWSTSSTGPTTEAAATEEGTPLDKTAGGGSGAAAGMSPHKKDFETETDSQAKGAESPDGPMQALHLHAAHGSEGQGSKADQQLGQVLQEGVPQPPPGAGASFEDRPFKLMPHHKEEAGVPHPDAGEGTAASMDTSTTSTTTEQVSSTPADTAETATEQPSSSLPSGVAATPSFGSPTGMERTTEVTGPSTEQVEQEYQALPFTPTETTPTDTTATDTAATDTAPTAAGIGTSSHAEARHAGGDADTTAHIHVDDGRVLKGEGIEKLAGALAEVVGQSSAEEVLLPEEKKSEEHAKSEKALELGHKEPYVPQPGEATDTPAVLMGDKPALGADVPSPTQSS